MSESDIQITAAGADDLRDIYAFLLPFMDQELLLVRSPQELGLLLTHAFVARRRGTVVGFAAVEVYSRKLAELQCLAVSSQHRRMGIGKELVELCIKKATALGVKELMAISASEELFRSCGFDYSLPHQKRALFFHPDQVTDSE